VPVGVLCNQPYGPKERLWTPRLETVATEMLVDDVSAKGREGTDSPVSFSYWSGPQRLQHSMRATVCLRAGSKRPSHQGQKGAVTPRMRWHWRPAATFKGKPDDELDLAGSLVQMLLLASTRSRRFAYAIITCGHT